MYVLYLAYPSLIVGIYNSCVGFVTNFPIFEKEVMQSCSRAERNEIIRKSVIARSAYSIVVDLMKDK